MRQGNEGGGASLALSAWSITGSQQTITTTEPSARALTHHHTARAHYLTNAPPLTLIDSDAV